jgi:hypothetical protein
LISIDVESVAFHCKVELCPASTVSGDAESEIVGFPNVTVTFTD